MALFIPYNNLERDDDMALVCLPDRFNWFAFLLPPFWALCNRLWRVLVGMLVFVSLLALGTTFFELPVFALYILAAWWLGLEANALTGSHLQRKGWQQQAEVFAPNLLRAEQRYFSRQRRQERRFARQQQSQVPRTQVPRTQVP